jgi:hypothetical protein
MTRHNFGEDGKQILTKFRTVAKSYTQLFRAQRDHLDDLLHGKHRYHSGVFRESLIREVLRRILPSAVSIDSGFIYGFDQIDNSRQIDILVWDSSRHAAVYQSPEAVIVAPEAVVAAISVKTALDATKVQEALEELLSIVPLERMYRSEVDQASGSPVQQPIVKMVVSYRADTTLDRIVAAAGAHFERHFASNEEAAREMVSVFQAFNPVRPHEAHVAQVERVLPKLIAAIETEDVSAVQGWGPPEQSADTYGPGLRRLPYLYAQGNALTSPFEKMVFYVLQATYLMLGTPGRSLVSAWGDFNPATGVRVGDASEVIERRGVRMLDPEKLAYTNDAGA